MDIQRKAGKTGKWVRRLAALAGLAGLVLAAVILLPRIKPAMPVVEKSAVWIDTVQRGPMLRQVRGVGVLTTEDVSWVPALTPGRVKRILVRAGTVVSADTEILELSNPELEETAVDARMQLRAAEAELKSLRVQLESQQLSQQAVEASVLSDYDQARLQADVNRELSRDGLISNVEMELSRMRSEELKTRHNIEKQRLAIGASAMAARLDVQQARVEQCRAQCRIKEEQLAALRVRAGLDGVLQEISVEAGQQVALGANLARVANPGRLKAEIRVPENQARDVAIGQSAVVDTRNGVIAGKVSRIDPSVRNGTVTVDIALTGELPKGARPDLSVDGAIELMRLADAVYVGQPTLAQENGTTVVYRLAPDGATAAKVPVSFGRVSVNVIEVLRGLQPGDRVILSDLTRCGDAERIQLR